MDSLTHLAMGHAMGVFAAGATPAATKAAYWGALIGNSLPDIDVWVGHLIGKGWSLHRKFTHTVGGMLLLSALCAGTLTLTIPGSSPFLTLGWTLAGVVVHVFTDCLNTFGTRPFMPFSGRVLGFGVLFLLDPFILGTLGLGSMADLAGWVPAAVLKWLYLLTWVYIALRWLWMGRVKARVSGAPGVRNAMVTAWLLGWRFLRECEGRLELGGLDMLGRRETILQAVEPAGGPAVEASRRAPAVAAFLQRARYPYARLEQKEGYWHVAWDDLANRLRRGAPQPLLVILDDGLQVVE